MLPLLLAGRIAAMAGAAMRRRLERLALSRAALGVAKVSDTRKAPQEGRRFIPSRVGIQSACSPSRNNRAAGCVAACTALSLPIETCV